MFDMDKMVKLGHGMTREVYTHPTDPTLVVKKAREIRVHTDDLHSSQWDNLNESELWAEAPESLRWILAPVIDVHPTGDWLIMAKVKPFYKMPYTQAMIWYKRWEQFRADVPIEAAWDLHYANLGLFHGRPVIHDYACGCPDIAAQQAYESEEFDDRSGVRDFGEKIRYALERRLDDFYELNQRRKARS